MSAKKNGTKTQKSQIAKQSDNGESYKKLKLKPKSKEKYRVSASNYFSED